MEGRTTRTRQGRWQDKVDDRRNYSRDVIALENVEPKKKKGTLAKIADRGGEVWKIVWK